MTIEPHSYVPTAHDPRVIAFTAIAIGVLTIITFCAVAQNMGTSSVSNRINSLQLAPQSKVHGEAE